MELINDLGTDLAYAFLVEKRYRQKIDSEEAVALIGKVKSLLETSPEDAQGQQDRDENKDSKALAAD